MEVNRSVIKDACCLQPPNDAQHIKLAELDTVTVVTNFACVHQQFSDILTGKATPHIKAMSEMLIQQWPTTSAKLVKEYRLSVSVQLLKCNDN